MLTRWAVVTTCLLATSLPIWSAGTVYEDHTFLTGADALSMTDGVPLPGRALTLWTYQITHASGGGARSHHLVNLVLHGIAGLLVWALARRLSPWPWAPWLAVLLFWTHPLHSEAVMYIAARSDVLATIFLLAAVLAGLSARPWWEIGAWLVLATISKEIAVVGIALVAVTVAHASTSWRWRHWAVAALALTALVWIWPWSGRSVGFVTGTIPMQAHVTSQAAVIWGYLWSFVTFDGITVDRGFVQAMTGETAVLTILLAGAVVAVWGGRRRWPLLAWAVAWGAIWVGPRFVLDAPELLSERHLYLGMVAASIVTGDLVARLVPSSWEGACRA